MINYKKTLLFLGITFLLHSCIISRENKVEKTKLLGRDYRLFQDTPAWELAKAVQDEDLQTIKIILKEKPAMVNYKENIFGHTLLDLSIMNQQFESFQTLIQNNADINTHDSYDGTSPLIESCAFKQYDSKYAKMLIENGAKINDVEIGKRRDNNSTRYTPLIAASKAGKIDLVELLVIKGADINYKNEFDQTALGESVMVGRYEVSYYLLKNGADYKRPIFYRPDYSIPVEKQDPNDKGRPMYLVDVLREDFFDFDTDEYKYKMKIVDFLKSKGIDYRATPIPEYIKKKAQENYPNNWKEYLEKY